MPPVAAADRPRTDLRPAFWVAVLFVVATTLAGAALPFLMHQQARLLPLAISAADGVPPALLLVAGVLSLMRFLFAAAMLLAMGAAVGVALQVLPTLRSSLALPLQLLAFAPPVVLALPLGRMAWAGDATLRGLPCLAALLALPLLLHFWRLGTPARAVRPALLLLWSVLQTAELTAGAGGLGGLAARCLGGLLQAAQHPLARSLPPGATLIGVTLMSCCLIPALLLMLLRPLALRLPLWLHEPLRLVATRSLPPAPAQRSLLRHLMLPPARLACADLLPLLPLALATVLPVSGPFGAPHPLAAIPGATFMVLLVAVATAWAALQRERGVVTALLPVTAAAALVAVLGNIVLRDSVEGAAAPGFWCLMAVLPLLMLRAAHHLLYAAISPAARALWGLLLWLGLLGAWWAFLPMAALLPRAVLPDLVAVARALRDVGAELEMALLVSLQQRIGLGMLVALGLTLALGLLAKKREAKAPAPPVAAPLRARIGAMETMMLALPALPLLTASATLSAGSPVILTQLLLPLWVVLVASLGMTTVRPVLQAQLGGTLGSRGMLRLLGLALPWGFAAGLIGEYCATLAGMLPPAIGWQDFPQMPDLPPEIGGIGGWMAYALERNGILMPGARQVFTELALAALAFLSLAFWLVALVLRVTPPDAAAEGDGEPLLSAPAAAPPRVTTPAA